MKLQISDFFRTIEVESFPSPPLLCTFALVIAINDLSFLIGSRALYQDANWHIKPKDKVGLIGANGTGKSTLLKLIVGDYTPNSGSISKSKSLKIGYLNQDLLSYDSQNSILHVAMEAFERQNQLHDEIEALLKKLETDYTDDLLHKLSDKQAEFDALDGYQIEAKAHEILDGLGFAAQDHERPLNTFSGGWRMRVMLAKILLQQPDILLLDEPTNHLDLPSIQWLEEYLRSFSGAIVIVSHDRYFLDRIVNKIVESKSARLTEYVGNYTDYMEQKGEREEIQRNQFKNQQQKIKEEERLIERFRAKASKAKMVQSRIKALEKMDRVDDVEDDAPSVSFNFKFSKPSGKVVATLSDISKSYPNIDILKNAHALIERGDKIALIGANGKGKSTLLRIIAGVEPTEKGSLEIGYNVTPTFFAQHQLEALTLKNTILEELQYAAPERSDTELRTLLGCFLFTGDDVFKKVQVLSGGEKSRVALAKTLTADANFLMLDEPTNHLDIPSVNILIQALQQYQGSFVVISHDRYLLDNVANKIWYIENQEIKEYPGTYAEYDYWRSQQAANAPKEAKASAPKTTAPKSEEKPKQDGNNVAKLQKQLAEVERQIMDKENALKQQEELLAQNEIYANPEKLQSANGLYQQLKQEHNALQQQWEELVEKIG